MTVIATARLVVASSTTMSGVVSTKLKFKGDKPKKKKRSHRERGEDDLEALAKADPSGELAALLHHREDAKWFLQVIDTSYASKLPLPVSANSLSRMDVPHGRAGDYGPDVPPPPD